MDLLTATLASTEGRILELDLSTGATVPVITLTGGLPIGLGVTSDGHSYVEDLVGDQIVRFDTDFNLVGFLDLGGDVNCNQGLGANRSRDDLLGLAAINAELPSDQDALFLTFMPDLTGLTFRGVIGGAGTDRDLGDVSWRPDCTTLGCEDGDPCTVDTCVGGQCVSSGPVCGDGCPWDCAGDDRVVDTIDFLALLADWGSCPGCAADNECDDGLYCNGVETCDPITGECIPGIPPCDDGLACTDNGCDEVNDVCVFTPVECKNDNNECTDTFCVEPDGCITEPSPTGTVCGAPGMICDGAGNCVPE